MSPSAVPEGQDVLPLSGVPQRLYTATPTRLLTWVDCPRRYRFTYLDRPTPPKGPPWAHNSMGAAVHSALADWWDLPRERRTPAAAADGVRRRWLREGFRDEEQSARWRERAAGDVAAYTERVDPDDVPVGIERTVATRTRVLALSGRLDRLDDRDGELVVVDYKTGRRVPTVDDARTSLALAAYAVAVSAVFRRPCHRVELHHLPSGEVAAHEHTPESLARKVSEAESIATDLVRAAAAYKTGDRGDATFEARPGPLCGWCDFRAHCPQGQQVAAQRDPWAGVEP